MTGTSSHVSQEDHIQFLQSQRLPIAVRRTIALTLAALTLTGLILTAVIVWQINQQDGQTRFLRMASRQRTLAEEVTVNALEAARLPDESADRIVHQKAITTAITTLDRVQVGLATGDASLDLIAPPSQAIKDLVLVASGPFARLKTNANLIAKTDQSRPIATADIEALADSNKAFQASTIRLVDELEAESKQQLTALNRTAAVCAMIFLMVMIVGWWAIIRPRLRRLLAAYNQFQTYRMAMDFSAEHMVLTDTDGVIMYANSAAEKITGYQRDEMIGRKAGSSELWGGLMDKEFYERLWKTIKHDRQVFTGQLTNRRKNGQRYTAESIISPALDPKGKVLFFVGVERVVSHQN